MFGGFVLLAGQNEKCNPKPDSNFTVCGKLHGLF